MKTIALAVLLTCGAAGASPQSETARWERVSAPVLSAPGAPQRVSARVAPATPGPASAGDVLPRLKAIALSEGEARVQLDGSILTLRPGSSIGTDIVRTVGADRIILVRGANAADASTPATVVVTFDAQGRSRVRVYWTHDRAVAVPREVH